jgi:triosephosphate isomerase (TIM)
MSRRPLVAGNWKMHKTPQETEAFIELLRAGRSIGAPCEVLLIPPFTSLDRAGRQLLGSEISLGAQDLHPAPYGAYTGAISAPMLIACGCTYALIGHSERRHVFGDSDETVCQKLLAALGHGLHAVLCVGETLDQRKSDRTAAVLEQQLVSSLSSVDPADLDQIVIAYEPVWAIGTGETASPEQAQDACAWIRSWISSQHGAAWADRIRILYGGSVKPSNAQALQSQPDIDGALVGGASLEVDDFRQIIENAMHSQGPGSPC